MGLGLQNALKRARNNFEPLVDGVGWGSFWGLLKLQGNPCTCDIVYERVLHETSSRTTGPARGTFVFILFAFKFRFPFVFHSQERLSSWGRDWRGESGALEQGSWRRIWSHLLLDHLGFFETWNDPCFASRSFGATLRNNNEHYVWCFPLASSQKARTVKYWPLELLGDEVRGWWPNFHAFQRLFPALFPNGMTFVIPQNFIYFPWNVARRSLEIYPLLGSAITVYNLQCILYPRNVLTPSYSHRSPHPFYAWHK